MMIGVGVLAVQIAQVRKELRILRTASSDNIQWNLSQLEVDLLVFRIALAETHHADDIGRTLESVRRRFDVLYSRLNTLSNGAIYQEIRAAPKTATSLLQVERFIKETVPLIDGPDDALLAAVAQLEHDAADLRGAARAIAIDGINIFAHRSTEQRVFLSSLLFRTSLLSGAMIIALAGVLIILFRQFGATERESKRRQQSNIRLNSMVGASLDAIIVADSTGTIIDFNSPATRIFGYPKEDAIGQRLTELIVPERFRDAHSKGMERFLTTGKKKVVDAGLIELVATRRDGAEIPVEVSIAASTGPEGTIFVSFLRDISARLKANQDLTEARDQALAADKAKSNFLAVMSHEMRTPLNGLMGTLDLIATTPLSPKQERYLDIANAAGQLLLRHINDVLDITKMEADALVLEDTVFSPREVVERVAEINRVLANERGNTITLRSHVSPGFLMHGDRFRLGQTLFNLTGNAVKFTANGSITIVLEEVSSEDGDRMMEFRVSDTGIGIAQENLSRVFDDFVTIDVSYSRSTGGTGLGLGICRRMVEAMGGEIHVQSELGKGSTFWLRIPLREAAAGESASEPRGVTTAAERMPSGQIRPLSVLVVEDNQVNRFVAREILEILGHEVTEAHDGLEGVKLAAACHFDVILMDISMPVMDGVEATERIRAGGGKSAQATIIGLTAHALPGERERFERAGMELCLIKPVNRIVLHDALKRFAADAPEDHDPSERPEAAQSGTAVLETAQILELRELLGEEKFAASLNSFMAEVEAAMPDIARPADEASAARMAALLHKVAGAAGTFGAARLRSCLHMLETCCKTGDLGPFEAGADDLRAAWSETRTALRAFS
ncbi:hybrid sensor histidine kinase/response regulator [Actibacterium sp. D379-3]